MVTASREMRLSIPWMCMYFTIMVLALSVVPLATGFSSGKTIVKCTFKLADTAGINDTISLPHYLDMYFIKFSNQFHQLFIFFFKILLMRTSTLVMLELNQEIVRSGFTRIDLQDQLLYLTEMNNHKTCFQTIQFNVNQHYNFWHSWFLDQYEARHSPKKQTRKQQNASSLEN